MVNSQSSSEHNYCSFILTWQLFFDRAWCSSSIKFFKLSIKKFIDFLNNYQF